MSWNFMLLIFINVYQVRWIVIVFPGLTISWPWRELLCGSVQELIKTDTQGLARTRIALCQRPGADTEETGRYDLAWKDLCSILNALSK